MRTTRLELNATVKRLVEISGMELTIETNACGIKVTDNHGRNIAGYGTKNEVWAQLRAAIVVLENYIDHNKVNPPTIYKQVDLDSENILNKMTDQEKQSYRSMELIPAIKEIKTHFNLNVMVAIEVGKKLFDREVRKFLTIG